MGGHGLRLVRGLGYPQATGGLAMGETAKATAIRRLTLAIDEIPHLRAMRRGSSELDKWRRNTEVAIRNTFAASENSEDHVGDFADIKYSLSVGGPSVTEDHRREAYLHGLDRAESILQSMVEEVREYWADEEGTASPDSRDRGRETGGRRFSERHGLAPKAAEITIRDDAPEDLRALVVDFAYRAGLGPHDVRTLACDALMTPPNRENWSGFPNIDHETRQLLDDCEWFHIYDVIEVIFETLRLKADDPFGSHLPTDRPDRRFADLINAFFVKRGIGWQLRDGKIEVRGAEAFEVAVRSAGARLNVAGLETASQQIHEALADLARRPNPDITGAMHHAMAAAECVARTAADDQNPTLGALLRRHRDLIPPPLDVSLGKMWGYASETARHVKEGGTPPEYEEAELVVITAAGVIGYLEKKLSKRPKS